MENLEQIGKCDEVYNFPQTPFVATFVGENNSFLGKVKSISNNKVTIDINGIQLSSNIGKDSNGNLYKLNQK